MYYHVSKAAWFILKTELGMGRSNRSIKMEIIIKVKLQLVSWFLVKLMCLFMCIIGGSNSILDIFGCSLYICVHNRVFWWKLSNSIIRIENWTLLEDISKILVIIIFLWWKFLTNSFANSIISKIVLLPPKITQVPPRYENPVNTILLIK